MTKEKILAMKPGVDLNIKVAEELMGNAVIMDDILGWLERPLKPVEGAIWGKLQPYSEDLTIADLVIERMAGLGFDDAVRWEDLDNGKYTKAEAICKAALLAMLEKRRIESVSDDILKKALGDEK